MPNCKGVFMCCAFVSCVSGNCNRLKLSGLPSSSSSARHRQSHTAPSFVQGLYTQPTHVDHVGPTFTVLRVCLLK